MLAALTCQLWSSLLSSTICRGLNYWLHFRRKPSQIGIQRRCHMVWTASQAESLWMRLGQQICYTRACLACSLLTRLSGVKVHLFGHFRVRQSRKHTLFFAANLILAAHFSCVCGLSILNKLDTTPFSSSPHRLNAYIQTSRRADTFLCGKAANLQFPCGKHAFSLRQT